MDVITYWLIAVPFFTLVTGLEKRVNYALPLPQLCILGYILIFFRGKWGNSNISRAYKHGNNIQKYLAENSLKLPKGL